MTISESQKMYRDQLSPIYGDGEARAISQMVFEKVVELDRLKLSFEKFRLLTPEQQKTLNDTLSRLLTNEPVQYILGEADFCGLKFKVNRHVLIPRPETEELVYWILEDIMATENLSILDIGTGSGCIPISLAKKLPGAQVEAVDISPEALEVARHNNALNGTKVSFHQLDVLLQVLPKNDLNIIVSNPPYITELETDKINNNVLNHEPHLALFAPIRDALAFYRAIAQKALTALKPGGLLYFEINTYKGKEVVDLLEQEGYKNIILRKDINENDRMVRAERP